MRSLPANIQTLLAKRQGVIARNLLWIEAKNRTSGVVEPLGIWNGVDHHEFTIDGELRTYYGAGGFIGFGKLTQSVGLYVRKLTATLSPLSEEALTVLREYEPKFAPVEVHVAVFEPDTNALLDIVPMFSGWIDTAPIKTPKVGEGGATATLNMIGQTRILTKTVASKRSHETQRLRSASDTFFANVAVTGTVQTAWGSKTVLSAPPGGGIPEQFRGPYGVLGGN